MSAGRGSIGKATLRDEQEGVMPSVSTPTAAIETLADLLEQLGGIAPARVGFAQCQGPRPKRTCSRSTTAKATVRTGGWCPGGEGYGFARIVSGHCVEHHLMELCAVTQPGAGDRRAGMMRLMAGLVRIPDVAFISWTRLPHQCVPTEPVPDLAPDLAVEVLSAGNTPGKWPASARSISRLACT